MHKFEELVTFKEYWLETIQNELYSLVFEYIERENINQTQLAERLGVTKGYISQVLNGHFNHSLEKLIELSLAIGVAPDIDFKPIKQYINEQLTIRNAYASLSIPVQIELNEVKFTVIRNSMATARLQKLA
ncbi:MAG: helix-turn-helix transcriptional regulator [Bacteroidetes bacterium]|nr:helix-turn-helix transcriptional regulator [Bacteroidota bacterium]